MGVNNTPNLGDYKSISSFRMWCQKMLPMVYDDSLSYYEVLCKVTKFLNDVVSNLNTAVTDISNLHEAYIVLQKWVDTYFDSLDVQTEINNKLDKMASDGNLNEVIYSFLDKYKEEIDIAITMQNNSLKKYENAISVLNNRMNNFTSMPNGSTAGDAELGDIRIGWDGVRYQNAGEAVRKQVESAFRFAEDRVKRCAECIEGNAIGSRIELHDASYKPLLGLRVFGKTTQDGVVGKNLVDVNAMVNKNMVKNDNGTYIIERNGSTSSDRFSNWFYCTIPAGQYIVSATLKETNIPNTGSSNYVMVSLQYADGSIESKRLLQETGSVQYFTATQPITGVRLYVDSKHDIGSYVVFSELQMERGNKRTEYVPYMLPSPDCPIPLVSAGGIYGSILIEVVNSAGEANYIVTNAPNGLAGLPVDKGGNYVDESGQHWITDEIDYVRGDYIQRIGVNVFTGNEDYIFKSSAGDYRFLANDPHDYKIGMQSYSKCSHMVRDGESSYFKIGDNTQIIWQFPNTFENTVAGFKRWLAVQFNSGVPMTTMGVLSSPKVRALSDEELAAYREIYTNKGVTTISNNYDAGMSVSYAVDTKMYIDNKFTELRNAIIATGANT